MNAHPIAEIILYCAELDCFGVLALNENAAVMEYPRELDFLSITIKHQKSMNELYDWIIVGEI